ncbi:hypothetical protein F7U66_10890 [Vibrio parahaemolyticus]|nr:hypothetical protein [Vibrio parahaemolyticus]
MKNYDENVTRIAVLLIKNLQEENQQLLQMMLFNHTDRRVDKVTPDDFNDLVEAFEPLSKTLLEGKKLTWGQSEYSVVDGSLYRVVSMGVSNQTKLESAMTALNAKYLLGSVDVKYSTLSDALKKKQQVLHEQLSADEPDLGLCQDAMLNLRIEFSETQMLHAICSLGDGFYYASIVDHEVAEHSILGCVFNAEHWVRFQCNEPASHTRIAKDVVETLSAF